MGLYAALYAGVSGLDSQSNSITATSNNIANVNTIGYKQQVGEFSTLVAGNASGGVIGSTASLVNQQGLIQSTTSSTDVAISGNGFIPVSSQATGGTSLYTRAGSFTQDSLGNFVNSDGYYLQGFAINPATGKPVGTNASDLSTVQISQSASGSATATSTITLGANFNAAQAVLLGSGETATLIKDSINAGNTASNLIIGSTSNGLKVGDQLQIVSGGNSATPDIFTYGGISEGRDITSSAASGDGNGGYTFNTESVGTGNISTSSGSNYITIDVANTGVYAGLVGQDISISGVTGSIGGISANQINGSVKLVKVNAQSNVSAQSGPGTITVEVAGQANATVTSGAFVSGASSFNVGGIQFNITANGGNGSTGTGTPTNIANGSVATVLAEMATYLNNNKAALSAPLTNQTFTSDSTGLYVVNTSGSPITGVSTSFNGPTGVTPIPNVTIPAQGTATILNVSALGTMPAGATSFNIGGATINVVTGGGNGSTGPDIAPGTNAAVLTEMTTYLNSTAGQAALANGPLAGMTFSNTTTSPLTLSVNNPTSTAVSNFTADLSTGQPNQSTVLTGANLPSGTSNVLTVSGTPFVAGSSQLTVGNVTIGFVPFGQTPGTDQVALGSSLQGTLTNIANYLNSPAGQTASGVATTITFSADNSGDLIATNTTNTAITGPTISLVNGAPSGSSTDSAINIASQAVNVFSITGSTSFTTSTAFSIAGVNFTVQAGALNLAGAKTSPVLNLGNGGSDVLQEAVAYLNNNPPASGVTFSYSANAGGVGVPGIVATNPTSTSATVSSALTTAGGLTADDSNGALTSTPDSNTVASNPGQLLHTAGATPTTFANGSVFNIGTLSITMGTTVALGSSDQATLANIAAYLNGAGASSVPAPLNGLVFSSDANNLYVSNASGATITTPTINFTTGQPSGTTLNSGATVQPSLQSLLTVPNSGSALSIQNRTYPFTGNILNATTASGDFMGSTATASDFTTGSLNFLVTVAGVGTSTFTYNATPNTALGQFNSLDTLAQAINATASTSLTASVVNNRIYIGAVDANNAVTFGNGDADGTTTTTNGVTTTVPGINWVQELDLPSTAITNVNAGSTTTGTGSGKVNLFNSLAGLATQINTVDPSNLIAKVNDPTGASTLSINEANPEQTIAFSDVSTNSGSLLNLFGFKGQNQGLLNPTTISTTGHQLYDTLTLPIAYSASSSKTDMSSGAVTPQYTKDITIYDSLGNSHTIAMNVVKLATNTWAMELTAVPATDVSSTTGDGQIASGTITFSGTGAVQTITGTIADSNIPVTWSSSVGASPSSITLNLKPVTSGDSSSPGLTQSAAPFDVSVADQNGSPVGQLTGVSINAEGFVVETFSNGQTNQAYQIPLAIFNNPNGLASTTGDAYTQTISSGQFNLSLAGQNGAGTFSTSSLEQSSVDLSTQLTDLIIAQQAYGANSKVLTVADQLLQQLDQIIQ